MQPPASPSQSVVLNQVAQLDLAAASGIALRESQLYVIADDQLELAIYALDGTRQGSIALLAGALPSDHKQRKAHKPDFEALLSLPDGSLLALGSGSTEQRMRGVWVCFADSRATLHTIGLQALYGALLRELPELNIEGATVLGEQLYLCSRGNGARSDNALVELDWALALQLLAAEQALDPSCLTSVRRVQLGQLHGVPLSLTDLASYEGGLVFSAAAEASANTYDDGACAGSVVGKLERDGSVSAVVGLEPRVKIEGLCGAAGATRSLFAVADADDPNARAPLFTLDPWSM